MIVVKLIGSAKKSFLTDQIFLEKSSLTIDELVNHLLKIKPDNTLDLDTKNLLIAVNGMDSSTLDGFKTKLKDNDIVSIIPIIHGGSSRRIQFSIMDSNVELFDIANDKKFHIEFLDELRLKHPSLILQSINSRFILGINHVKKILSISLYARKNNSLLSKKIETDILLRFAITTQISSAIEIVGQKPNEDFLIIAIGKKSTLGKIYSDLKSCLNAKSLSKNNQLYLKRQFKISNKQLDAVYSKYPLEDLLVEKATILL